MIPLPFLAPLHTLFLHWKMRAPFPLQELLHPMNPTFTLKFLPPPPMATRNSHLSSQASSSSTTTTTTTPLLDSTNSPTITIPTTATIPTVAVSSTIPTISIPAFASAISATNASPTSVPSSVGHLPSPVAGSSSPALTPALHWHLKPSEALHSPSHLKQLPALGNLAGWVIFLEGLVKTFKEWMHKDKKWKDEVNHRLQMAGIWC